MPSPNILRALQTLLLLKQPLKQIILRILRLAQNHRIRRSPIGTIELQQPIHIPPTGLQIRQDLRPIAHEQDIRALIIALRRRPDAARSARINHNGLQIRVPAKRRLTLSNTVELGHVLRRAVELVLVGLVPRRTRFLQFLGREALSGVGVVFQRLAIEAELAGQAHGAVGHLPELRVLVLVQQAPGVAQLVRVVGDDFEHADVGLVAQSHGGSVGGRVAVVLGGQSWGRGEFSSVVVFDEENIVAAAPTFCLGYLCQFEFFFR